MSLYWKKNQLFLFFLFFIDHLYFQTKKKLMRVETALMIPEKIELYDIQKDFIKKAQKSIEKNQNSIFSSPTGTGKTISLLKSIEPFLKKKIISNFSGISDKNIELLKSLDVNKSKIYYASRTHSQLNQAVKELKKLKIDCDALVIGSRMLYCKHEDVKKSNDIDVINEKCKKLRDKDKCQFYLNLKNPQSGNEFEFDVQTKNEDEFDMILAKRSKKSNILDLKNSQSERISLIEKRIPFIKKKKFKNSGIHDIEDLKENDCNFCPYYKAKELVKTSSLIFLPYQILFSKDSRESFNLNLEDAILIIDEAHNIYETVIQINSAMIFYDQIRKYKSAFLKYFAKLEEKSLDNKLNSNFISKRKKMTLNFIDILSNLLNFCEKQSVKNNQKEIEEQSRKNIHKNTEKNNENPSEKSIQKNSEKNNSEKLLFVNKFLIQSSLQNYNMLLLKEYTKTTNIIQILEGYEKNLQFSLYSIINFLILLTNSDNNGLIIYDNKKIRFTPLDAKLYFEEIKDSKSIILAGGTMEPLDNLYRVFENINFYSYKSVCTNFNCFILPKGPSNLQLRLTYENRNNLKIMNELINTIKNLIVAASNAMERNKKFGGIVCFVPSKSFLENFKKIFLENCKSKLNFFFDDKQNFEKECQSKSAVLFAIMGGSLSEGINFNDNFCRLLIIIGLPYPNTSLELQERIKFNGKNFLTNQSMKIVNQTLGRALRHKNDFASLILIDQRYESLKNLIVPWIKEKIEVELFVNVFKKVHNFLQTFSK